MIENIINKEFITDNTRLNIVFVGEASELLLFIRAAFPLCSITNFTNTFYNINNPHIIICNNRSDNLTKSIELCKFFHIPLLLVDHKNQGNSENLVDIIDIDFHPFHSIAISNNIFNSWNRTHSEVLDFDIYNDKNINKWKSLIIKLCKSTFMLKEIK